MFSILYIAPNSLLPCLFNIQHIAVQSSLLCCFVWCSSACPKPENNPWENSLPTLLSHQMLPNKHPFKSLSHDAAERRTPHLIDYVHITPIDSFVLWHSYLPLLRWTDVDGWAIRRVNWEKKTTDVTLLHSLGLPWRWKDLTFSRLNISVHWCHLGVPVTCLHTVRIQYLAWSEGDDVKHCVAEM